jgi:hypothetical protein
MPRRPPLHAADDLLAPALERAVEAIGPPESDAALVALARILARTVDRMSDAERAVMIGQTAPQVLKVLNELEERAGKRRRPEPRQPSKLDALRAARAASDRGRVS